MSLKMVITNINIIKPEVMNFNAKSDGNFSLLGVIPLYPQIILSPGQFLSYKTFFK